LRKSKNCIINYYFYSNIFIKIVANPKNTTIFVVEIQGL